MEDWSVDIWESYVGDLLLEKINWLICYCIVIGVVCGLVYLYYVGIIYGYLVVINIFLIEILELRIFDFGFNSILKVEKDNNNNNNNVEFDVYCFGVILFELLIGK